MILLVLIKKKVYSNFHKNATKRNNGMKKPEKLVVEWAGRRTVERRTVERRTVNYY